MGNQHKPDWTLVSYAEADHEIWQNRYGQLAVKTLAGTWKPVTLGGACDEIMLGARIKTAIMLLGLTTREAAHKVGCTQPQLIDWASSRRCPRVQNETKLCTRLIIPAMQLELGQSHSLMQGLTVMDD
jgi:hypothetical protein|nr:MAG TPA: LAMBDA REPRESSOR (TRIPLE MUTANT)/DNA COMPLEX-DNA COMPLEX, DOUBLE HELIX, TRANSCRIPTION-DNA.1A [Caudoviricetes sp.]